MFIALTWIAYVAYMHAAEKLENTKIGHADLFVITN